MVEIPEGDKRLDPEFGLLRSSGKRVSQHHGILTVRHQDFFPQRCIPDPVREGGCRRKGEG
jgi:hypothetical protein